MAKTVHSRTRAGRAGKAILCPECGHRQRVFHFSWSAKTCEGCGAEVAKYSWLLSQDDRESVLLTMRVSRTMRDWLHERAGEQGATAYILGLIQRDADSFPLRPRHRACGCPVDTDYRTVGPSDRTVCASCGADVDL